MDGVHREPPVTPIGRDELALKRHRFFAELLTAAQAAADHRVRFNPLGPDVAITDNLGNFIDCLSFIFVIYDVLSEVLSDILVRMWVFTVY